MNLSLKWHQKYFVFFILPFFTLLFLANGAVANKKHIAIVTSEKYSIENAGDNNHYHDNVEILLSTCTHKLANEAICTKVTMEDPAVQWQTFDALVIGAVFSGDSSNAYSHIKPWLNARESDGAYIVNGPNSLRLMFNKASYLKQLQERGIPVIPTIYLSRQSTHSDDIFDAASERVMQMTPEKVSLEAIFDQSHTDRIVIKGAQSSPGSDHILVTRMEQQPNHSALQSMLYETFEKQIREMANSSDVLLQKYMLGTREEEMSFVFLGKHTYAYKKMMDAGKYKAHRIYARPIKSCVPDRDIVIEAKKVKHQLEIITNETIHKARIDVVRDTETGRLYVIEAELIDPGIALSQVYNKDEAVEIVSSYLHSIIEAL